MPIETYWTFAALLLAGRKIAVATGAAEYAEARAELVENGNGLNAALRESGLAPLAREMERKATEALAFTHSGPARDDAQAIFWQVAPVALADRAALAAADLDPRAACDRMVAAIKASDPRGEFAMRPICEQYFRAVVVPLLQTMIADDAYMTELTPTLWREALNRQGITLVITQAIKDDTAEILALVRELRDVKQTTVHEDTLIAIARKIRPRVTDRAEALRELERAADLAAEQSERSHAGGNVDAFVDGVLRRLADLTEAGRLDAAATAADDAVDRAEAGLTRLLDAAIDQHLLAYDSEGAARQITRRLTLETADPGVLFEALRREFRTWYERGRDRGLRLDLEVAIAIARTSHGRARDADECGTALNDLGNALLTLGGRETGTARLKEAVAAYRDALKERTRDRAPLQWAMTRMNLGNALRTLGERETGTDRLVEAVAAYRDALKEITLDRVPPDWATTQHNLGNALTTLSVRESSVPHLKEAIAAYREALKVRKRDLVPLQWAITQMYLAVVLAGDDLLTDGDFSQALAAIDGAREVFREAGVTAHSKKCEVIRRSITGEKLA